MSRGQAPTTTHRLLRCRARPLRGEAGPAGPRPADPVEFAIWCAAISRPPPPLGSGFDVRPSLLEALDGVSRLVIAEHGLRRALAERQGDDVTAFGEPPRLPEYVRADLSSSGA